MWRALWWRWGSRLRDPRAGQPGHVTFREGFLEEALSKMNPARWARSGQGKRGWEAHSRQKHMRGKAQGCGEWRVPLSGSWSWRASWRQASGGPACHGGNLGFVLWRCFLTPEELLRLCPHPWQGDGVALYDPWVGKIQEAMATHSSILAWKIPVDRGA